MQNVPLLTYIFYLVSLLNCYIILKYFNMVLNAVENWISAVYEEVSESCLP